MIMPIDQQTSQTFHVLKFCSILMVIFGHFFGEIALSWVPVTVGLIIFSFSSGMFTSMKYDGAFEIKKFWKNKFRRLGVNLLVIDIILLVLFIYKGEKKIYKSAIFFSGCLLEIYLLHPYFFISFTHVRVINFVVSLILILFLAKSAASFSQVISRQYLS